MAKLTLKGVTYEIAPFMLEQVEQAARFIDQVNEAAGKRDGQAASLSQVGQLAAGMLGVFAVGIGRINPAITLQKLKAEVGLQDILSQQAAFGEILKEAGLAPLVATDPTAKAPGVRANRSKAPSRG